VILSTLFSGLKFQFNGAPNIAITKRARNIKVLTFVLNILTFRF
jgi:hypothetical protein